jgi:hypothetical protein
VDLPVEAVLPYMNSQLDVSYVSDGSVAEQAYIASASYFLTQKSGRDTYARIFLSA